MKIAVLTHNPNSYIHLRLTEIGKSRGHEMCFIQISYCYMNISSKAPTVNYRGSESFNDLDAIIPRISPKHTFYGTAVLRQFERMGVYTLNNSFAITWSRDKLRALQQLAKKGLPMPVTGFADSPQESEKLIDLVGGAPIIVRLLEGTEGKGTIFAETHQAAISVINAFKQLKTNILVQEYIQEAKGADIQCLVIGNKVVAAVERLAQEAGQPKLKIKHANLIPIKISAQEKKMAVQAAKAMKLNMAGVDLIRSERGPLVLDIDSSPNIEKFEKTTEIDVATQILDFIEATIPASRG